MSKHFVLFPPFCCSCVIEVFQLKNVEQMTEFKNYHLKILNNMIGSGKNHQRMLKTLAKNWMGTWIAARWETIIS